MHSPASTLGNLRVAEFPDSVPQRRGANSESMIETGGESTEPTR